MDSTSKPQIHHPPAFCTRCKLVFPARDYAFSNAININLEDCKATCPKCNGLAKVFDGSYNALHDRLSIALSPNVSAEARAQLLLLVAQVKENKTTLAEAKKRAENIDRRFGKIFDIANWSDEARATFFSSILVAAATLSAAAITARLSSPPTVIIQNVAQPKSLRKELLSSSGIQGAVRNVPPSMPQNSSHSPNGNAGTKPHTRHNPRQKGPE